MGRRPALEVEATLEAYRALETLFADGKVGAIGVSNFMVDHLTALLERASVVRAVVRIDRGHCFLTSDAEELASSSIFYQPT